MNQELNDKGEKVFLVRILLGSGGDLLKACFHPEIHAVGSQGARESVFSHELISFGKWSMWMSSPHTPGETMNVGDGEEFPARAQNSVAEQIFNMELSAFNSMVRNSLQVLEKEVTESHEVL